MSKLYIVRYILGLNDKHGTPLKAETIVLAETLLGTQLSWQFGGCTIYETEGYWEGNREPSRVYESYTENEPDLVGLEMVAADTAELTNQTAVLLLVAEATGELRFIGAD